MKITIKQPQPNTVPLEEIAIGDFFCYKTNIFYKKSYGESIFIINIHHGDSCHYHYGDVDIFDNPMLLVNKVEAEMTVIK